MYYIAIWTSFYLKSLMKYTHSKAYKTLAISLDPGNLIISRILILKYLKVIRLISLN